MELRLARKNDLLKLNNLFDEIIADMYKKGIKIWHEIYPYCEFESDIQNKNLYILTENENIVATFCLFEDSNAKESFEWENKNANAMYLSRLAVNVNFLRRGCGNIALNYAINIAKEKSANFIRLFVAESNIPAIKFYEKNGFKKVSGQTSEYAEPFKCEIIEYAYEKRIN